MKKPKIYFIQLSACRDDGSRATVRRDVFGTFTTSGNAYLTLKALKENTAYKTLLDSNDGTIKDKPMYLLNVEY